MIQVLMENSSFNGVYVALKSFSDHSVVGSGATPQEALIQSEKKGCKDPVITFVPNKDMVQIY